VTRPPLHYERDPKSIYAASFKTVRAEANLDRFSLEMQAVAIRLIHACGMVEVADRIAYSANAAVAGSLALAQGAPVLCDCEMVGAGIIRRYLPADNQVIVTLNDPSVPDRAANIGNTRSAAAVELWEPHIEGAVVAVGNAPTARRFGNCICGGERAVCWSARDFVMSAWLHIVGIGEDGVEGLTPATRAVVEAAEIIVGGSRHHGLVSANAERIAWPSPFDTLIEVLKSHAGKRVVVLATGDPLWYSGGARIGREIDPAQITYHPQVGAFQLAAARMGWSMADLETLTVHGRPVEQMIAFIQPNQRLLILTTGAETPAQIAGFLTERGFGQSKMTVLAAMGGENEKRFDGVADSWDHEVPAFNTLAVECVAAPDAAMLPRVPGLADELFQGDGTMTKQEIRAASVAKLMPMRGALLWDVGTGCGSVAVEWMRAARYARAIGIEPRADRRTFAANNALALGVPKLELIDGHVPEALTGLEAPDAIFIGGGLSHETFDACWSSLRPLGRLVANAVTLESEAVLLQLYAKHGGDLARIQISRADAVGRVTGWRPSMPVTQWSLIKR